MARYGPGRKQETKQRIIDAAGRRFKQSGIDGSGIATLMGDADLTNGAFYAHFSSKNDLVAAVVEEQLAEQCARFEAQAAEPDGLERIVREYLTLEHRDDRECGCPSAALLDEIDRCTDATKQVYTDGLLSLIDGIAAHLAPQDPGSARLPVLGVVALMIGTLQLSRAVTDRELARQMLDHGARTALALLQAESPDSVPRASSTSRSGALGDPEFRSQPTTHVGDRSIYFGHVAGGDDERVLSVLDGVYLGVDAGLQEQFAELGVLAGEDLFGVNWLVENGYRASACPRRAGSARSLHPTRIVTTDLMA